VELEQLIKDMLVEIILIQHSMVLEVEVELVQLVLMVQQVLMEQEVQELQIHLQEVL
jgi:hypothetical protein